MCVAADEQCADSGYKSLIIISRTGSFLVMGERLDMRTVLQNKYCDLLDGILHHGNFSSRKPI